MNGIYWISAPSSAHPASAPIMPKTLAVVLCPRGGRYLNGELAYLKRSGINTLVSLLSHSQVGMLELGKESAMAEELGMEFLHHPIPDHELPPDAEAFRLFAAGLAERLRAGQRIGIHCWGSIGRATVSAACTLIHLGWEPATALTAIEAARGCPVPDTEEQKHWILNYKAQSPATLLKG